MGVLDHTLFAIILLYPCAELNNYIAKLKFIFIDFFKKHHERHINVKSLNENFHFPHLFLIHFKIEINKKKELYITDGLLLAVKLL